MPAPTESICFIYGREWEGPGGELCPDCRLDIAVAEVAVDVNLHEG
ncbi:hypothetical protein [Thermanaeromonas sp. C210]|nr:hypothetical protein [Thermanaeromonas sp. C210]